MRCPVKTVCALAPIIGIAAITALSLRQPPPEKGENRPLPKSSVLLHDDVVRGRELDDQMRRVLQRNYAKDAVAADVIDGRLTLFEAAARFRTINIPNSQAEHWLTAHPYYYDQPYELALCRSVIGRVAEELRARGSGPEDDTVARLEVELAEHLRRNGRVRLPE